MFLKLYLLALALTGALINQLPYANSCPVHRLPTQEADEAMETLRELVQGPQTFNDQSVEFYKRHGDLPPAALRLMWEQVNQQENQNYMDIRIKDHVGALLTRSERLGNQTFTAQMVPYDTAKYRKMVGLAEDNKRTRAKIN